MNNFEEHILKTLLFNFRSAMILRKKYTKGFDKMFKKYFGESFGFELEIYPKFFKDTNKTIKINNYVKEKTKKIYKNKALYSRFTDDCSYKELSFAVFPSTLDYFYKTLKKIDNELKTPIGSIHDLSSSIHIHIPYNEYTIENIENNRIILSKNNKLLNSISKLTKNQKKTRSLFFMKNIPYYIIDPKEIRYNRDYNTIEFRFIYGTTKIEEVLKMILFFYNLTQPYNKEKWSFIEKLLK